MFGAFIIWEEYENEYEDWVYAPTNWGITDELTDERIEFIGTEEECEKWVAENYPYLV